MTAEELKLFEDLLRRLRTTKAARFEAYRRIRRRKLSSTVSVAFLSLSIICFNIAQLLPGFSQYNDSISAVTIMLSSMVLVLSLLISNLSYGERELKYYQCSTKFSQLEDRLNIFLESAQRPDFKYSELYTNYFAEYHQIIEECGINHIPKDYHKATLRTYGQEQQPKGDGGTGGSGTGGSGTPRKTAKIRNAISRGWHHLRIWTEWYILDINTVYWLLAILIPCIAGYLIFHCNLFAPNP